MMEFFDNAKLETSEDTRKKAIAALGLDEVPISQKLDRAAFDSDEAYFSAVALESVRHNSPEFRQAYRQIRQEYAAQRRAEAEAAAEAQHQAEIEKAIRDCVLSPSEQSRVDDEARSRAQADLASGKISFQQLGDAVTQYAETLTSEAKELKVHNSDINRQIREAMRQATSRKR